ncbi:Uncharacterised protein [Mycobacteroides abscessus subsp. abscessus]|nr:Uncharacterised protein [Mycobacteroides abscessus subsp. abscessus]
MSTELTQSKFKIFCYIGGDAGGFAYRCDAACTASCSLSMLQSEFRVDVEVAACHHEVLTDDIGVILFQRAKLAQY